MSPPGERDDPALVASALEGDNSAFSALMTRHKAALYRLIRRYVGDADEALDLVQESFLACWTKLATYDPARPFTVWLHSIALNKCRDWTRRRKVRQFFFGATSIDADTLIAETQGSGGAGDMRLARLDEAIAALPANLKEPLLLTLFDELSHQQAGELLGVSAKAIETRIYRAKEHLRRALAPFGTNDN